MYVGSSNYEAVELRNVFLCLWLPQPSKLAKPH